MYIDPIACNIHHARTTREFVYTRVETPQRSFEDFLFKKELWTSIVIARHLPWDLAGVWLDDCTPQTPTLIAVGSTDAIISPDRVAAGFGSWQARLPLPPQPHPWQALPQPTTPTPGRPSP